MPLQTQKGFLGQVSKVGISMILVLQGGGGRMKEPGDAIAISERLFRASEQSGDKHDTCSAGKTRYYILFTTHVH